MKKIMSLLLAVIIMIGENSIMAKASTTDAVLPESEVVEEFDVYFAGAGANDEKTDVSQPKSHITYKVTKLGTTSEIGDYTGQTVSAEPGITISLSQMKSTTFSASSNVAFNVKSLAQSTLGFNFSASYSIGHSASRQVPSTYNGRKVKRAEIKAYRLYDNHSFKVTWTSIHVKTPQYYGTYWAKKPSGYHYKMVYYYQ